MSQSFHPRRLVLLFFLVLGSALPAFAVHDEPESGSPRPAAEGTSSPTIGALAHLLDHRDFKKRESAQKAIENLLVKDCAKALPEVRRIAALVRENRFEHKGMAYGSFEMARRLSSIDSKTRFSQGDWDSLPSKIRDTATKGPEAKATGRIAMRLTQEILRGGLELEKKAEELKEAKSRVNQLDLAWRNASTLPERAKALEQLNLARQRLRVARKTYSDLLQGLFHRTLERSGLRVVSAEKDSDLSMRAVVRQGLSYFRLELSPSSVIATPSDSEGNSRTQRVPLSNYMTPLQIACFRPQNVPTLELPASAVTVAQYRPGADLTVTSSAAPRAILAELLHRMPENREAIMRAFDASGNFLDELDIPLTLD